MRRRVVNVLAVVSAVVCVLSLSLVGRSLCCRSDAVWIGIGGWTYYVRTSDGQLVAHRSANTAFSRFGYNSVRHAGTLSSFMMTWEEVNGIQGIVNWGTARGMPIIILPLWVVPIVSAVLPVWWWRVRRRAGWRGFAVEVKGSSPATEDAGDTG
jgi:hypothetical protein